MACVRSTITPSRVPHPRCAAAGWGVVRSASALLLVTGASVLHAQSTSCGLSSITEQAKLSYPPIARAARVAGTVILLTRFDNNGVPVNIRVVSGPPVLQPAALEFIKGWRANEYEGPRECPIVVTFNMIAGDKPVCSYEEAESPGFARSDTQHVTITVHPVSLCDPAATITKTHKRWF